MDRGSNRLQQDRGSDFRILICADNTFATAWNQQPLKMGVDIDPWREKTVGKFVELLSSVEENLSKQVLVLLFMFLFLVRKT